MLDNIKRNIYKKLRQTLHLEEISLYSKSLITLQIENYLQENLHNNPKYQSPDKLNKFEFQAFSQFGEDGIIEEIFKRIGVVNQFFVEFGVETGIETNSTYLLYKGWKGLWMDGGEKNMAEIENSFSKSIASGGLKAKRNFITAENIEQLFQQYDVPKEFDFLCIDIDRNDYYVWKAISHYNPRVVMIEYNAVFKPGCSFVVEYDADKTWDGTSNFGASLDALCDLGNQKGYKLVGCGFAGANAFFVREDLIAGCFAGPFTSLNHYEPPRYFLYSKNGHPRRVGM